MQRRVQRRRLPVAPAVALGRAARDAYFGEQNIKQGNGEWIKATEWDTNHKEFVDNFFTKNMTAEDAAWETWTGRQLMARGFKTVEIRPVSERGGKIHDGWYPIFRK